MDNQTQETVEGLVRHLLSFLGGYLVIDGIATQVQVNDMVNASITLSGLVLTVGAAGWSIWNKRHHALALNAVATVAARDAGASPAMAAAIALPASDNAAASATNPVFTSALLFPPCCFSFYCYRYCRYGRSFKCQFA